MLDKFAFFMWSQWPSFNLSVYFRGIALVNSVKNKEFGQIHLSQTFDQLTPREKRYIKSIKKDPMSIYQITEDDVEKIAIYVSEVSRSSAGSAHEVG